MLTGASPTDVSLSGVPRPGAVTALFLGAIAVGSLIGGVAPEVGGRLGVAVDPLILALVGLLFFTLRLDGFRALRRAPRVVLLALAMNFVLVPVIAVALTSVLVPSDALRLGVLIYCLFPCTDWFLGFTRMAGGDTSTGAALIPVQMFLQLTLYPVWLTLFTGGSVSPTLTLAVPTLLTWFVVPAGVALALRLVMRVFITPRIRMTVVDVADRGVPCVIAAVIVALFSANVGTILADPASFAWVLLVVFVFFVVVYLVGEGVSRLFRLRHPEHALLTMTISARNAPLMLAVTTVALPDQPLVYAAIVIGMLVEFPHLTVLTHLLRRRATGSDATPTDSRDVAGRARRARPVGI
jgi:ACR3 family arsenite efflux pump ArsB